MSLAESTGRRIAATPRADLLPREMLERAAVRATRRIVVLLILLALVLVGAGLVGATLLRAQSQAALAAAQQHTTELQAQQAEFVEIRALQRTSREAAALVAIPLADRLDWREIIGTAIDALPASAFVTSADFAADSPTAPVEQSTGPFTASRIGVIELVLHATRLEELNAWLDRMRADPAFSEVSMRTVELVEGWAATATLSIAPELTAVPLEGVES